jgi:hypothetical protein
MARLGDYFVNPLGEPLIDSRALSTGVYEFESGIASKLRQKGPPGVPLRPTMPSLALIIRGIGVIRS